MANDFFRKKSMEHITSPEQLHDYMRVTSPRLWMVLCAIIPILIGFIIYAATTRMETTLKLKSKVEGSVVSVQVPLQDVEILRTRMPVRIGGKTGFIQSIDRTTNLELQIRLDNGTALEDGFYQAVYEDGEAAAAGEESLPGSPESSFYVNASEGKYYTYDTSNEMRLQLKNDRRVRLSNLSAEAGGEQLGTVTGAKLEDSAWIYIQIEGDNPTLADGIYDIEIVTESTTPISFLLN